MNMFFQVILESFVIFGINTILGSILFVLLRNYVKDRITEWLYSAISEYIRNQLELTIKNADETAKALKPIIDAIIRQVMKDFEANQKQDFVKIPFLGKVPAPLIQALIGKFLGKQNNESVNPFG